MDHLSRARQGIGLTHAVGACDPCTWEPEGSLGGCYLKIKPNPSKYKQVNSRYWPPSWFRGQFCCLRPHCPDYD